MDRLWLVLDWFWPGLGPVLEDFGQVLGRFWPGVEDICPEGPVLEDFWQVFGPVFGRFWPGVEDICPEGRLYAAYEAPPKHREMDGKQPA